MSDPTREALPPMTDAEREAWAAFGRAMDDGGDPRAIFEARENVRRATALSTTPAHAGKQAMTGEDRTTPRPQSRSLVCAIARHHECDGNAPNGPAGIGNPCSCACHRPRRSTP